ncbi:MAG: hypothetical protein AB7L13_02905 [Acidimicrobiia bacterium]
MDLTAYGRITDSSYLFDVRALPIEELRRMRAECREVDDRMSFLRRIVQGRLDIVRAEHDRRVNGDEPREAIGSLIGALPDTFGVPAPRGRGGHLRAAELEADTTLLREVDDACGGHDLGRIIEMSDVDLGEVLRRLAALEDEVSSRRQNVYESLDTLSAELTRRYRTGEATVESLLEGD